jgi:hypothetical protein
MMVPWTYKVLVCGGGGGAYCTKWWMGDVTLETKYLGIRQMCMVAHQEIQQNGFASHPQSDVLFNPWKFPDCSQIPMTNSGLFSCCPAWKSFEMKDKCSTNVQLSHYPGFELLNIQTGATNKVTLLLALLPVRERLWNHGREWTSTPNITYAYGC